VVGLLDIVPAAAGGLPGIVTAIQAFRQDTFTALNLPIEPNPLPTVMPHGVVQVAVVGALNVVGAIIFPAFNHILSAAFETPDAVAQELAATGDPVRAVAAGVNTAAGEVTAAVTDVADSVVTAVNSIRAASGQSLSANRVMQAQNSAATTTPSRAKVEPPQPMVTTTTKHPNAALGSSHPLRDAASNVRQIVRSVIKKTAGGTAGQSGSGGTTLGGTKGKHGANGDNGASGSNGRGGTARKHG
jgi:hypothetical protein